MSDSYFGRAKLRSAATQVHALIQRNARNILIDGAEIPPEPLRCTHLTRPLDQLKKTRKPFQRKFAHPQIYQSAGPCEPGMLIPGFFSPKRWQENKLAHMSERSAQLAHMSESLAQLAHMSESLAQLAHMIHKLDYLDRYKHSALPMETPLRNRRIRMLDHSHLRQQKLQ